jgi:hypothetical protein
MPDDRIASDKLTKGQGLSIADRCYVHTSITHEPPADPKVSYFFLKPIRMRLHHSKQYTFPVRTIPHLKLALTLH